MHTRTVVRELAVHEYSIYDDMFTPSHAERRKARGNSSKRRFDLESESEMDEEEEEPAPTPRKTLSRQVKKGKSPARKSPKNT